MGALPVRVRLVGVLCVTVLLGSCSAEQEQQMQWTEPEWMAEQLAQREQFTAVLQACMDANGWNLTVDESAGFAEPFESRDELERAAADMNDCLDEQGVDVSFLQAPLTDQTLRTMYSYDVDTYECLLAQGIEMENQPPSEDQYVETALQIQAGASSDDSWWPYGDPALGSLSRQDFQVLEQTCPERWAFANLS